jgi:Predicted membrane protein (DUF2231)
MSVDGIPLHVLVVHLAVVLTPLTALGALVWVSRPRWRGTLRVPLLAVALGAVVTVWLAFYSGPDYLHDPRFAKASPEKLDLFRLHARYARLLLWSVTGCAFALFVAIDRPDGRGGRLLPAAVAVLAVAALVTVVFTGHAGAKASWAT